LQAKVRPVAMRRPQAVLTRLLRFMILMWRACQEYLQSRGSGWWSAAL
jgi:hypothetical protein